MKVMVNLDGVKARVLADVVSVAAGEPGDVKYLARPYLGYVIGEGAADVTCKTPWDVIAKDFVFVSCKGDLVISDVMFGSTWYDEIMYAIKANGFECELLEAPAADCPATPASVVSTDELVPARCLAPMVDGCQVVLPYVMVGKARDNFLNLVDSKRELISNALGVSDIPVYEDAWQTYFPWAAEGSSAEQMDAVRLLVEKMVALAEACKRIGSKERPHPNPKYAFRCFLLRLGFIGKEYGPARKLLLSKLEGNGSWLNGAPEKEVAENV